ncbi:MAG: PP2C family protein-serine/threonine phosphatase [Gemmatimonadales bacterium]
MSNESDTDDRTIIHRSRLEDDAGAPAAEDLNTTVLVRTGHIAAGPDERAHYLTVVAGQHLGMRIELGPKSIVLGRVAPADVVLDDGQISRNHCRVAIVMDEVFVNDLGSSNGTFVDGARVERNTYLPPGGRMHIGGHVLEHEWRLRSEVEASMKLDHDLASAGRYVQSLLPDPVADGPIRTEWVLLPSATLGGDVFGYHRLGAEAFAIYLIDVSGHGAGAALHAVSVINTLRQSSLPGIDMRDPAAVAGYLNAVFPMESHGDMYLTLWYGVYDRVKRTLAYSSAGHHPSYLVGPARDSIKPLKTRNVVIGARRDHKFAVDSTDVPPGSRLYVFSDGIFEVDLPEGGQLGLEGVEPLLLAPAIPGTSEPVRLLDAIRARCAGAPFEDDFTLVVATFL